MEFNRKSIDDFDPGEWTFKGSDHLLDLYAHGCPLVDLADKLNVSVGKIAKILKTDPAAYEIACQGLQKLKNAKLRRVSALSTDAMIEFLEKKRAAVAALPEMQEELAGLIIEAVRQNWKTVKADSDADIEAVIAAHEGLNRIQTLEKEIDLAREIRLKDISAIGEAADRRADLNEGKATERIENVGTELTLEDVEQAIQASKDAGTGIDNGSIS